MIYIWWRHFYYYYYKWFLHVLYLFVNNWSNKKEKDYKDFFIGILFVLPSTTHLRTHLPTAKIQISVKIQLYRVQFSSFAKNLTFVKLVGNTLLEAKDDNEEEESRVRDYYCY